MKQKLYSLFLAAAFSLLTVSAWADDYEIATAQDLADFAATVNGGETDANAVLTADIDMSELDSWTAIGDWGLVSGTSSASYKGHFDGQGHTIKNFNFDVAHNYYGIFGVVSTGALIENFTVEGNITVSGNIGYAAGVVAYARDKTPTIRNVHSKVNISSTSTAGTPRMGGVVGGCPGQNSKVIIDRCTYSGTLNANDKGGNYGGIIGYILNNTNVSADITNCLFDGKLQGTINSNGAQYGGIIGYTRKGIVSVKNCLSLGTFEYEEGNAMNIGQFIGRLAFDDNTSGCTFDNNYYVDNGYELYGTSSGGAANGDVPVKVTAEQLASGEIAFKLNGDQSEINWYQALKNTVFTAQQYVVTANGTKRDPQNANTILTENDRGSYDFILPDFVLHTNSTDIPVGDVVLEDVTIEDDGTFSKTGTFNVPDENIPSSMAAFKSYLQNIPYTLSGKVNGDKLYANINDINVTLPVLGAYAISVEVGTDNFEAKAPTGDAYPAPQGTDVVYANGSFNCDMTPKEGSTIIYSNTDASIIDAHSFADGFCTVCGALDENYMAANAEGFFEIANEKQLVWFATYVNEVNAAAKGTLTDNIALTKAWTNPIGNASVAYTGKFDGQGKAITGFDQTATTTHNGLFGNINGATVQNFSISGSLTSDKNYCGVIGLSKGSSKVKGIHSSLNLDIQFKGWAGGVVGGADGYIVIEECSFDGTLDTHNFDDSKGGILGYANGATIKNCLFSGTIVGEAKQHYGGILGYVNNNAFGGVQNCLSIGSVTTTNTSHNGVAAIIGNMNTSTKVDGIFNNYWLTGSSYAGNNGAKAPDAEAPFEVTAEQLASGEVAYKLGAAWSQLLGTDNTPVLGTDAPVSYVGDAGYATLYDTTTGYTLNGDVKAYVAVLNSTWLDLSEIDNIPAGTPVILKGSYYNKLAADLPAINVANDLKGTDADTTADGTMYILANGSDGIGFYKATGTIPAGKAYYQSTSGAKAFFFDGDDATGIDEIVNGKSLNGKCYNLAGQRIQKMQRGINIVGSKKILY
ncbi:MAG: hypothetical protein IJ537_01665 [Bacteroidaceae bacterium]|nr:hypothetical protein [Bacteroidaceae bacterium]